LEGADACGAGAGAGAGADCLAGLGAGLGAGFGAAATGVCFMVAGGLEAFELLPPLPPQLATPTAIRGTAAAAAIKVIGLLRFIGVPPVRVWESLRFPAARPFVVGHRETPSPATGAVVRAAGASEDSRLALSGGSI